MLVSVLAIAADQLARAYFPHTDIGFGHYEARGLPLVMRAALTLLAGVTIGAFVGRLLPALLVGIGLSRGSQRRARPRAAPLGASTVLSDIEEDPAAAIGARLHTAIQYRLPNGDVVSADEGEIFAEAVYEEAGGEEPDPALLPEMIIIGISPDRYAEVVVRESLALGALAVSPGRGRGLRGATQTARVTRTAWRLIWRQQRWELLILIGGTLLLAVALLAVAWQTGVTNHALAACARDQSGPTLAADCRSVVAWGNLLTTLGAILPLAATVAPFIVGLLIGAPLVAREIEKRTAPIAWSLSLSRRRWLLGRAVPMTLLVGVSLLALGMSSEVLVATNYPEGRGFMEYGSHGPLIAARGVAILALGIVIGLAVGRVLPAILITIVFAVVIFGAVEFGRAEVMRAEATWVEAEDEFGTISMIYDSQLRSDATGDLITDEQAVELYPEEFGAMGDGTPPGMTRLYLATSPDRYGSFVARESGILVLVAVIGTVAAVAVIPVRRSE